MDRKEIEEKLQGYCDRLNECLDTCSGIQLSGTFLKTLEEMEKEIKDSGYYWDRTCYIAHLFDFDKCWQDMYKDPHQYECKVSDDIDEHPGIVICFRPDIQKIMENAGIR